LHFVSTREYAQRVEQLGEEPWRITHCGALSLEDLGEAVSVADLERRFSLQLDAKPLLVTFHPVTLQYDSAVAQLDELLAALGELRVPCIFTLPIADAAVREFARHIRAFVDENASYATLVESFGRAGYFGMMRCSSVMVGNSSSGIIEAGSFNLPVVNIGDRQAGRARGSNVIDAPPKRAEILSAIRRAASSDFRQACCEFVNPYAPPASAAPSKLILDRILSQTIDENLMMKKFYEPK